MRFALVLLLALLGAVVPVGSVNAQDKVIYHIDQTELQALRALRSMRNHLDTVPGTQIIVVTHADGVDMLFEGAKDKKNPNIEYGALISDLRARGVRFEICEITLRERDLKKDKFILEAEYVTSGVVRIGQLQFRERYAYIKP